MDAFGRRLPWFSEHHRLGRGAPHHRPASSSLRARLAQSDWFSFRRHGKCSMISNEASFCRDRARNVYIDLWMREQRTSICEQRPDMAGTAATAATGSPRSGSHWPHRLRRTFIEVTSLSGERAPDRNLFSGKRLSSPVALTSSPGAHPFPGVVPGVPPGTSLVLNSADCPDRLRTL